MLYVGYSRSITGNSEILGKLKKDSDDKFNNMSNVFEPVNAQINNFITKELRPLILETISDEIKKRDDKEKSRNALK
jgi:hypothetical protein